MNTEIYRNIFNGYVKNILKYYDLCQWQKKTLLSLPKQQENP